MIGAFCNTVLSVLSRFAYLLTFFNHLAEEESTGALSSILISPLNRKSHKIVIT